MMVTIDDETLARAVLTFCLDSAGAMMYALVKGTGSAASALQLIADSGPGNHKNVTTAACTSLDAAFINGVTRWGRTINDRGMASFHGSLVSWQQRLASLPSKDPDALRDWFIADGTQWIIAPHHPCWPSQLNDLSLRTDGASPLCLWGKGDPKALVSCPEPVGIVGSRGVSDYGRQSAHELALRMARAGHLVVSGGALGTDAAAHWGAVKAMDEMSAALAGTHRRRIRWRTEPYRSEKQPEPVRADRKPFGRFDFRTVPRNRAGGKTVPAAQPSDRGFVIHSDRGAGTCAFRRAQHCRLGERTQPQSVRRAGRHHHAA